MAIQTCAIGKHGVHVQLRMAFSNFPDNKELIRSRSYHCHHSGALHAATADRAEVLQQRYRPSSPRGQPVVHVFGFVINVSFLTATAKAGISLLHCKSWLKKRPGDRPCGFPSHISRKAFLHPSKSPSCSALPAHHPHISARLSPGLPTGIHFSHACFPFLSLPVYTMI